MSVQESENGYEPHQSVDSGELMKYMVGCMWKMLVVITAVIGAGIYIILARNAPLVATILIGSGILAFYLTYRTSQRKVRSRA